MNSTQHALPRSAACPFAWCTVDHRVEGPDFHGGEDYDLPGQPGRYAFLVAEDGAVVPWIVLARDYDPGRLERVDLSRVPALTDAPGGEVLARLLELATLGPSLS